MSRYIDADALITDLNKGLWGKDWDKVLAEAIINEAPSIDLVRCVECKYEPICNRGVQHTTHELTSVTIGYKSVDFCSYGEREGE